MTRIPAAPCIVLALALVGCSGRPTITVEVVTSDEAGAEVPLANAFVEIWSSDGMAWLETDGHGRAVFENLEDESDCPPSLDCDWPETTEFNVHVRPDPGDAICPTIAVQADFDDPSHTVTVRVPPLAFVDVDADVDAEGLVAAVRGAGWPDSGRVNTAAVSICVWADESFSVVLEDRRRRPQHTWSELRVPRGERLVLSR